MESPIKDAMDIFIVPTVVMIWEGAFYYCSALRCILISESATSLGKHVFKGCLFLTMVMMPHSLTSIGICTFGGYTSLASITS